MTTEDAIAYLAALPDREHQKTIAAARCAAAMLLSSGKPEEIIVGIVGMVGAYTAEGRDVDPWLEMVDGCPVSLAREIEEVIAEPRTAQERARGLHAVMRIGASIVREVAEQGDTRKRARLN